MASQTSVSTAPALQQAMPQLKQMANSMKGLQGGNISQMLGQVMGQNNPMLQSLMNGGNPEQLVRQQCEQQGINIDEFMNQIQQAFNG